MTNKQNPADQREVMQLALDALQETRIESTIAARRQKYESAIAALRQALGAPSSIPFAGYDPNFAPGSNPENPQPEEYAEQPDSIADDINAILYQCDRGNVSLPWLIDALRGIALRQALSAPAESAAAMPDGWKLVPIDPTSDMGWKYLDAARQVDPTRDYIFSHAGYRAAIAAAPPAPIAFLKTDRTAPAREPLDSDKTAEWLTLAHTICTDSGVPQGRITWRLDVLRGLLSSSVVSAPLTYAKVRMLWDANYPANTPETILNFVRAIEAAHNIKAAE